MPTDDAPDVPAMRSASQLADDANVKVYRVEYLIRRLAIKPAFKFGNCNVYSPDDVTRIRRELTRIEEAHASRRAVGVESSAIA